MPHSSCTVCPRGQFASRIPSPRGRVARGHPCSALSLRGRSFVKSRPVILSAPVPRKTSPREQDARKDRAKAPPDEHFSL
jgi:hypothetical protein